MQTQHKSDGRISLSLYIYIYESRHTRKCWATARHITFNYTWRVIMQNCIYEYNLCVKCNLDDIYRVYRSRKSLVVEVNRADDIISTLERAIMKYVIVLINYKKFIIRDLR